MPYRPTAVTGLSISRIRKSEKRRDGQDEWTEGMREYAANEKVAFIIHTGDICYVGGLNSHIKVMNSSNMPETQVFYAIGNHDLVAGKYGEELFKNLRTYILFI